MAVEYFRHTVPEFTATLMAIEDGAATQYDRHETDEKLSRTSWYQECNRNDPETCRRQDPPRLAGESSASYLPNPRLPGEEWPAGATEHAVVNLADLANRDSPVNGPQPPSSLPPVQISCGPDPPISVLGILL